MSTKCSIAFAELGNFTEELHIYQECFEEDYVYLSYLDARSTEIKFKISKKLWDVIVKQIRK